MVSKKTRKNKKIKKYRGGNKLSLCFIIACKVYKNYKSFIDITIRNINIFYPDSTIILVDNNSTYKEYFDQFKNIKNVIILENTSDSKFELGAYNFAIEYIIKNKLTFNYYTLLQDLVIPTNKYDYTILKKDKIPAICIYRYPSEYHSNYNTPQYHVDFLKQINIYQDNLDFKGCAFVSFICNHESLIKIYEWTKNLIITVISESEGTERIFGRIIQYLNNDNNSNVNIYLTYNTRVDTIDKGKELGIYFMKISQGKTQNTINL